MLCQRCNNAESTGFLVHLCDKCFSEWEKEIHTNPSTVDLEPIDLSMLTVSGGGLVPDDAQGVKITGVCDDVRVEIIRK